MTTAIIQGNIVAMIHIYTSLDVPDGKVPEFFEYVHHTCSLRGCPIRTKLPSGSWGGVKILGTAGVHRFDHFPCKLLKSKNTTMFPVL